MIPILCLWLALPPLLNAEEVRREILSSNPQPMVGLGAIRKVIVTRALNLIYIYIYMARHMTSRVRRVKLLMLDRFYDLVLQIFPFLRVFLSNRNVVIKLYQPIGQLLLWLGSVFIGLHTSPTPTSRHTI